MSRKIQIMNMSLRDSITNSQKLAQKVEKSQFIPEYIIWILNGGLLPAQIMREYFHCKLVLIRLSRPLSSLKGHLKLDRLPSEVKWMLRKMEMSLKFYRLMRNRSKVHIAEDLPKAKYLIVDDSLDTGRTVEEVYRYLDLEKGIPREDIAIAVLTQIFDDAKPGADFYIFKNINFTFPWSLDSSENKFYHQYLARNKLS